MLSPQIHNPLAQCPKKVFTEGRPKPEDALRLLDWLRGSVDLLMCWGPKQEAWPMLCCSFWWKRDPGFSSDTAWRRRGASWKQAKEWSTHDSQTFAFKWIKWLLRLQQPQWLRGKWAVEHWILGKGTFFFHQDLAVGHYRLQEGSMGDEFSLKFQRLKLEVD